MLMNYYDELWWWCMLIHDAWCKQNVFHSPLSFISDNIIWNEDSFSYSISDTYTLKMGGGQGQNITHAWFMIHDRLSMYSTQVHKWTSIM